MFQLKKTRVAACCLGTFLSLICLGSPRSTWAQTQVTKETITIKGSDTMIILNEELAAEYHSQFPSIAFDIEGRGSETGIAALLDGSTDIAASSRPIKAEELAAFRHKTGTAPLEIVVALDGIGIYVHGHNPITQLTLDQLGRILKGQITNWREVGGQNRPIHIYNRDRNSGTRAFMQQQVLKGQPFSTSARDISSTALVMSTVARNPSAIGYGGIAYSEGARIIRLAPKTSEPAIWPSREDVVNGRYPLSRRLYYYLDPTAITETLKAFVDWVLNPKGQEVIVFVGYYPASNINPSIQVSPKAPVTPDKRGRTLPPGPIEITPENMKQYGLDLTASLSRADGPASNGRFKITLQFRPSPEGLPAMVAHIGEDAEIPLALREDGSIDLILRRSLVSKTVIHLISDDAEDPATAYLVPLAGFLPVEL